MTQYTVHTDGASRGNPGPAAIAYVINNQETVTEYSKRIGVTTNNQAEYQALLAALDKLVELSIESAEIEFFADSELMIKQLLGEYKVKNIELKPVFEAVKERLNLLEQQGNTYKLNAIRREYNKRADELANWALDNTSA